MSGRASRTIYVGNFPGDIREWEVEDLFYKYGPIVDIDLKVPPRPPGYCFIEFKDAQDAEDGRDGYSFDGHRLRVELAHVGRGLPSLGDCYSSYSGGGSGGHGSVSGSGHGGVSKRSEFRVIVNGLPSSASWQDLKDHMRRAGDVCFAQVFRDGNGTTGIVDYSNYEDMKYAVRSESLMTLNSEIRLLGPIYGSKVMRLIEASQEAIAETSLEAGAGAGQGAGAKAEAEVYQETEVKVLSAAEAGASVEAGAKESHRGISHVLG